MELIGSGQIRNASSNPLRGFKILLAEDRPDTRMLLTTILKIAGATIHSVVNGLEALKMAQENQYDVIVLDIQMPFLDGRETLKFLRANGCLVPVIAVTAARPETSTTDFNAYITKPFDRADLITTIVSLKAVYDSVPSGPSSVS